MGLQLTLFLRTLQLVGLSVAHLKPTNLVIQGFNQSKQLPLGKISIKTRLDAIDDLVNFLVIDVDVANNAL